MSGDETAEKQTKQYLYSFDQEKKKLQQDSGVLYQAIKITTDRAKAALIASDYQEIANNSMLAGVGMSILISCVTFSTIASLLAISEVEGVGVKWGVTIVFFLIALIASLAKYLVCDPKNRTKKVVSQLTTLLYKDVQQMAARLRDLSHMGRKEKLMLLTSTVKIIDSILIPTHDIAPTSFVLKNFESVNAILKVTSLELLDVIKDSKHYLTLRGKLVQSTTGQITAKDQEGLDQLQHVDRIFRLYLPLYAMLKRTSKLPDV